MGNKRLSINRPNQRLYLREGQSLTLRDSISIPVIKNYFGNDNLRNTFENFSPELELTYENSKLYLKVSNISEISSLLTDNYYKEYTDSEGQGIPYSHYLETGIILVRHSRPRKHPRLKKYYYNNLNLPRKGTSILWGTTNYGRSDEDHTDSVGKLTFRVDLNTGYINFQDYTRVPGEKRKWVTDGPETNVFLICNKIFPVSSKPTQSGYESLYRGQDSHDHKYYFYGLVFRLKKNISNQVGDTDTFILSNKSRSSIAVSYDVKTLSLNVQKCESGYKYKDLFPPEAEE